MDKKIVVRTLTQIMSRVNGWLVPIHAFNKGRAAEWKDRNFYKVKK